MRILVTGCAGFIGSHLCESLLKRGDKVLGIDNLNDYYEVEKKRGNLYILNKYDNFNFIKDDITTTTIINDFTPELICHLASMAGVRYSIENPKEYVKNNIEGFVNIMEQARKANVKSVIYASSSSVYGLNKKVPFSESDPIKMCNSPYACSKYSMEVFGKMYYQLYKQRNIGLRFFTVYGPRGRPDMAPFKFLKAIHKGEKFYKYGDGTSSRDYTYIDDIVSGIIGAIDNHENINCEIYNLGNSYPISLNDFISNCERVVGRSGNYEVLSNQEGDVPHTYANITKAKLDLNYNPKISLEEGLKKTYGWLKNNL
jgi:UDP-glucuronate 4-epimerase